MFEFFFEVIAEVVVELVFHLIADPIARLFGPSLDTRSKKYSVKVALIVKTPVYFLFGGLIGYISLLVYPEHLIAHRMAQWTALLIVPICAGYVMGLLGRWLEQHGKKRTDFERFTYGFVFALSYSLVRFIWGNP